MPWPCASASRSGLVLACEVSAAFGLTLLAILHLQRFHFFEPADVARLIRKHGLDIRCGQILCEFDADHTRTENDNVHVVVLDALMGGITIVRDSRANTGK